MEFGKLTHYTIEKQRIHLDFEGKKARIEILTPAIINVFCGFESEEHRSKAIEGDKAVSAKFKVKQKEDGLWITTEKLSLRVSDGFYVDFFDKEGKAVCTDYRGKRTPLARISKAHLKLLASEGHNVDEKAETLAVEVVKRMEGSEHFYGLGDKTGFLDKRHYEYEMWNTDNPDPQVDTFKALYKSIPFFMALTDTHVYGIFLDNTHKSFFNMGKESEEYYYFGARGGNLDYYYIAGNSLKEVLEGYTYLTGTCPLPQRWTLGYHQSRWGYMNEEDMEEIAEGMRNNDIPCDALHFDIDYMEHYKVFTWNQKLYHGDAGRYLKSLADRGFKPVTIIDPGVKKEAGYEMYEEGAAEGYFASAPEGGIYVNEVWPGEAVYPDFGNPKVRRWWAEKQRFLLDMGVRGVWNDMNEPASFRGPLPDEVIFSDEEKVSDHAAMHNVYGHLMAKATYEGLKAYDGRRPFVITRACYAGSQKYATAWTGDNTSMWAHLQMLIPQLCNLGLSGMPFVGTDIGGFGGDTTPELLARWIEAGCFSPLCRNHSALGSRRQEPWLFGEEVLGIYRKYLKLRYHWIPYFYDLFYEEEKTGAPIMRPLVFHYEKDETVKSLNDEFMLGSQVLVAPVVVQGMCRRMVYLPEGVWYDYWTEEKLTGPQWLIKDAPLDVCPIYVKAGSVIPAMEPVSYVGEKPLTKLILEVYPGEGSYDHYLDNGEDFAYRDGAYHHYRFTVTEEGKVETQILHAGYDKPYEEITVCVHGGRHNGSV